MKKYPIGIQSFSNIRENKYIYVDKTDLVYQLAQEHVCFLCRPRRFGKSLLLSTLEAYFLGRKDLFDGLKIMNLENAWEQYPVLRIDFANRNFNDGEKVVRKALEAHLSMWEQLYGANPFEDSIGSRFQYVIEQAHKITGKRVVVLIDEYDKPLLDVMNTNVEEKNRDTLKEFYSTFKAADEHLKFVMLTGVTKFSQVSVFSGFNQPNDISMSNRFEAICGITEAELHEVFAEPIKEMATKYNVGVEKMKDMLKCQYDGYHFGDAMTDIYNPFSIVNAFSNQRLDDYWFRSGTPTYLMKLLGGHNVNIQKLLSKDYKAGYFIDYRADVQDPLAMLYQSGYLTIKGMSLRNFQPFYTLDFPNNEVRGGFLTLCCNDYLRMGEDVTPFILDVDDMLRECRLDELRDAFTSFLASIPYEANKDARALNFETHFQYTFYLLLRVLSCYTTLIEKQNSHGRADIIIECPKNIFIFEFKLDGSADEALQQIENKGYAEPYLCDSRSVYKIGVNISSATRTVNEWKVVSPACIVDNANTL